MDNRSNNPTCRAALHNLARYGHRRAWQIFDQEAVLNQSPWNRGDPNSINPYIFNQQGDVVCNTVQTHILNFPRFYPYILKESDESLQKAIETAVPLGIGLAQRISGIPEAFCYSRTEWTERSVRIAMEASLTTIVEAKQQQLIPWDNARKAWKKVKEKNQLTVRPYKEPEIQNGKRFIPTPHSSTQLSHPVSHLASKQAPLPLLPSPLIVGVVLFGLLCVFKKVKGWWLRRWRKGQ